MGCGVGGLNSKEVLKTYKLFFEKEILFDCEVVIYGHSTEDYDLLIHLWHGTVLELFH